MIDCLRPYPEYRDSGVPWLAQIPAEWAVRKLRDCGAIVGGMTPAMNEPLFWRGDIPWVTPKDMKRPEIDDSIDRVTAAALQGTSLRRVPPGAVLLVVRGMILAKRVPIAVTTAPVTINQDMKALVPTSRTVSAAYLANTLAAAQDALAALIDEAGHGTRRLPTERWRGVYVPIPTLEEQAAIVRFLDHADRRIRRYIRAKQRLITLLEEEKQAIIHRAVTRGLDPSVRLKPSGVDWLGDVPEHWEVVRLKQVATIQTGITLGKHYGDAPLVERPYLRVANVQTGRLSLSRITTVRVPPSEAAGSALQPGDVLMTEGGDIDKLGRGCVWRGEIPACLHQNHIFAVRPRPRALFPQFLVALMGSPYGRSYFQTTAKQTTNLAATNSTTLGDFPLRLPGVDEQQRILARVGDELVPLDAAMARADREIVLLREYRTRLIADVVTGKLDVREAAARLPYEPEEPEVPDEADALTDAADDAADDLGAVSEETEA